MFDLVRRTCDGARGLVDFEGVYSEQVRERQEAEAEEYGGEFRFVNLGPAQVKRMMEAGVAEEDREALGHAYEYWMMAGGYAGNMEAGSVDRGDAREAIVVKSMGELAKAVSPVSHVRVMGGMSAGGVPTMSEAVDGDGYVDRGIIDWSLLLSQGPLPETEDWF